ncbi:MAG: ParB/RepB/Spo0J family partition protein [Cenarchaeum sp. SB0669_bin_11]|nr:ParB/RepB/Spo0J family partition protein [Gammaproteobacteria bacterium]MYL10786.1 ParB/RepB/Spo0J family partition protein [Cenarchaeum sp. SB0669_bin_11]
MGTRRSTGTLREIAPGRIDRNPENPRLVFRQDEMESLLASIDALGIQVPLTVYRENGDYRLIDGERRWRCALKLNFRKVPALVQDKPTELQNLLLMYNIHALREQWDYFTIASKLARLIDLYRLENKKEPNEIELSKATGLTRGQIRRCRVLLNLPEEYKDMLLEELKLPKSQQKLSEDFFIEMERSLKTLTNRLPEYEPRLDSIRKTLVKKFQDGTIRAVTDFRQLSKIATAIKSLGISEGTARESLEKIFNTHDTTGIREAYENTVEFEYDEQAATRRIRSLREFLDRVIQSQQQASLAEAFLEEIRELYERLKFLVTK